LDGRRDVLDRGRRRGPRPRELVSASLACPACGILAAITNRGEYARHGVVRILAGRREVACLLSGARATLEHDELAVYLVDHASKMDELAASPGTAPRERAFYRAASARARLIAERLRRGILPPPPRPDVEPEPPTDTERR
jgi:hypothetical protein